MSIVAYVGLPGHGKTYGVVANVLLPALKSGRTVVTNIPLTDHIFDFYSPNEPLLFEFDIVDDKPIFVDSGELIYEKIINGSLYIIDEAQLIWGNDRTSRNLSSLEKAFFTKHRHFSNDRFSCEIVIVTQDLSNVSSFIRSLIEETFRSIKLTTLGASKNYRIDVYTGSVTGSKPSDKKLVNQFFGTFIKDNYKYYVSQTQSSSAFNTKELKVDNRGVIWKRPIIYIGFPFSLLFILFAVYLVSSYLSSFSEQKEQTKDVSTSFPNKDNKSNIDNNASHANFNTSSQQISKQASLDFSNYKSNFIQKDYRLIGFFGNKQLISNDSDDFFIVSDSFDCSNISKTFVCNDHDNDVKASFYSGSTYLSRNSASSSFVSPVLDAPEKQ